MSKNKKITIVLLCLGISILLILLGILIINKPDDKRYDGTQYILWEFLRMLGVKLPNPDTLSYIKCALHKSNQWEYEKEWRLIDSNLRDNIISENKTWVSLKPTAIYYGTNISSDNKNRLHSIAQGKNLLKNITCT